MKITTPPIFIIGHFRSGTSLMHKLLACDKSWRYISEYELIFPYHSLSMERWLKPKIQRMINWLGLRHPNFNNYLINLDDPNEDEALLVSSGAYWGSYWSFIFPSHASQILKRAVSLEDGQDRELWKSAYLFFLKRLLWRSTKQKLLVKSPPNTARLEVLLEMLPNARFIYLHRNTENVLHSMKKIWLKEILYYFCLQKPDDHIINNHITEMHTMLKTSYQRDKHLIPPENLMEIRYEDLIANPLSIVSDIYNKFNMPMDERIKYAVINRINEEKDYQESKY